MQMYDNSNGTYQLKEELEVGKTLFELFIDKD